MCRRLLTATGDAWWVHHHVLLRNILTSHAHGRTASLTRIYVVNTAVQHSGCVTRAAAGGWMRSFSSMTAQRRWSNCLLQQDLNSDV